MHTCTHTTTNTPTTNHTNTDIRLITDTDINYTATIENIAKDNRNLNYIKKFISNFNINPSSISKVIFKNSYCFISFTTLYAKDYFISLNPLLKTTDYNRLFLHNYLSPEIILRKHIYFHAIKANLIKGYKYLAFSVCMYACMCACMHVCVHVCVHVCMCVCMYVCMYVCMCVCVRVPVMSDDR